MICHKTNKVIHKSKNDAEISHKKQFNKLLINTYKCNFCGGLHLGRTRNLNRFQKFIDFVIENDEKKNK